MAGKSKKHSTAKRGQRANSVMRGSSRKSGSKRIVLIVVIIAIVAVVAVVFGLRSCNKGDEGSLEAPATSTATNNADMQQAAPDMQDTADDAAATPDEGDDDGSMTREELEEALATNTAPVGENERDVESSTDVPTTAEVYASAEERGFEGVELGAAFNMDGTSVEDEVLDPESSEQHPSYVQVYVSSSDVTWFVYVNDGAYMAVPAAIGGSAPAKEIILSETDYVVQYDALKNAYSNFPLDQLEGAVGVKVDRIDVATLESYTPDRLEGLL